MQARHFGALVRERREALKMRQDDLALATGVGRRFILELEAGKASCQLGRALVVAAAVGLRPFDLMNANNDQDADDLPDLEDDGRG
jgi:transcriptional regulator with XRE-family HTH domain